MRPARVCFVVCANGFGHFVRTVHLASALAARVPAVRITVACSAAPVRALASWPLVARLIADERVSFHALEGYPRWHASEAFYGDDRILSWDEALAPLALDGYDLVLSDNFVETLRFTPRALLVGSFLWHDVYLAYRPDSAVMRQYHDRCVELLQRRPTAMIVNRYFAMPALAQQTQTVPVGMLPSRFTRTSPGDLPASVLFTAHPGSEAARATHAVVAEAAARGAARGLTLFIEKRLAGEAPVPDGVGLFDYGDQDLSAIGAIVARAGMGTITDGIVTGTPVFAIGEDNPEMRHNAARLEALGLGWQLPDDGRWLDTIADRLLSEAARAEYRSALAGIDLAGLDQATAAIAAHLD